MGTQYELKALTTIVSSLNGRDGDVTLTSADVTNALGYTPGTGGATGGATGIVNITSSTLSVTDPDTANYEIELQAVGTPGTYNSVMVDAYGRVTGGSNTRANVVGVHLQNASSPLGTPINGINNILSITGNNANVTLCSAFGGGLGQNGEIVDFFIMGNAETLTVNAAAGAVINAPTSANNQGFVFVSDGAGWWRKL